MTKDPVSTDASYCDLAVAQRLWKKLHGWESNQITGRESKRMANLSRESSKIQYDCYLLFKKKKKTWRRDDKTNKSHRALIISRY